MNRLHFFSPQLDLELYSLFPPLRILVLRSVTGDFLGMILQFPFVGSHRLRLNRVLIHGGFFFSSPFAFRFFIQRWLLSPWAHGRLQAHEQRRHSPYGRVRHGRTASTAPRQRTGVSGQRAHPAGGRWWRRRVTRDEDAGGCGRKVRRGKRRCSMGYSAGGGRQRQLEAGGEFSSNLMCYS